MKNENPTTILIIDDESVIRESYADFLEDHDFRVLTAENGRIGLELMEEEKPDLVLTDLRMPEINGLEVLQRAHEISPDTPLIVISGTGRISDSIQALRLGAWDYILKPVQDMSVITHSVNQALERARLRLENRAYQENLEAIVRERTQEIEKANQRLREAEGRQRMILNSLRIGILVIDPENRRVVEANSEASQLIGLPEAQLLDSRCRYFQCCGEGKRCPVADLHETINNSEEILHKADGGELAILKTVVRIELNGRLHLLESFIDISRRREVEKEMEILEAQLARAQKMEAVGTLAGGLAHDLNNALNGIFAPTSILINKLESDIAPSIDLLSKQLNRIQQSGYRISDMVSQLMAVSSRQELSLAAVDLNLSVKHVIKIAQNTFDKSIEILPEFYREPARTSADPTQIEQVLLNLAINASHAMTIMRDPDETWGGRLEISVDHVTADDEFIKLRPDASVGDYWKISVKDTGIGMNSTDLSRIFTPFFTTKEKGQGTGLGLSMVYSIVKQHKGIIEVDSLPYVGTTFTVYLPVLPYQESKDLMTGRSERITKGDGQVLIVDDEEISRITATEILKECGYRTMIAEDGFQAVEIYEKNRREIDLVLLDMVMPKMSGRETYVKLKEINPEVKVLLVSGFREDERVKSILEMGDIQFLQKPYDIRNLSRAVSESIHPDGRKAKT